jgi:hypothetical protein
MDVWVQPRRGTLRCAFPPRTTYMDVGSAELCRERGRPTYMDVGSAELCRERSRPTSRGERNLLTDHDSLFTTHFHIR